MMEIRAALDLFSKELYINIISNQALQPTVTTPVKSGSEQGTAAEL
jgi:hypothetical protein